MNEPSYDLLVFIGRFQPFHDGHLAVVRRGLVQATHLLVLIGSAKQPRSLRNPFTAAERSEMIAGCLQPAVRNRMTLAALADVPGDDAAWTREVRQAVSECVRRRFPGRAEADLRIGLVGHSKDSSSYYLRLFPEWGLVNVANHRGICATALRAVYFRQARSPAAARQADEFLAARMPAAVLRRLRVFTGTPACAELGAEWVSARRRRTAIDAPAVVRSEIRGSAAPGAQNAGI